MGYTNGNGHNTHAAGTVIQITKAKGFWMLETKLWRPTVRREQTIMHTHASLMMLMTRESAETKSTNYL